MHWSRCLINAMACDAGVEWARKQRSARAAWRNCNQPAWLWWAVRKYVYTPMPHSRRKRLHDQIIRCACRFAREGLRYIPQRHARIHETVQLVEELANCKTAVKRNRIRAAIYANSGTLSAAALSFTETKRFAERNAICAVILLTHTIDRRTSFPDTVAHAADYAERCADAVIDAALCAGRTRRAEYDITAATKRIRNRQSAIIRACISQPRGLDNRRR